MSSYRGKVYALEVAGKDQKPYRWTEFAAFMVPEQAFSLKEEREKDKRFSGLKYRVAEYKRVRTLTRRVSANTK